MHALPKFLIAATAFVAAASIAAPPAQAMGKWRAWWGYHHGGHNGGSPGGGSPGGSPGGGSSGGGSNLGAPGPIAGAGLPFLLLAGGYVLVRRHRSRRRALEEATKQALPIAER